MIYLKLGGNIENNFTQQVQWYLGEYLNKNLVQLSYEEHQKLNEEYTVKTLLDVAFLNYISLIDRSCSYTIDNKLNIKLSQYQFNTPHKYLSWLSINPQAVSTCEELYNHYVSKGGLYSPIVFSKELKSIHPNIKPTRLTIDGKQVRGYKGVEIK